MKEIMLLIIVCALAGLGLSTILGDIAMYAEQFKCHHKEAIHATV